MYVECECRTTTIPRKKTLNRTAKHLVKLGQDQNSIITLSPLSRR